MSSIQKILLRASIISFFSFGLFGPIYAIFVKDIGGDVLEAGTAFGLYLIASGGLTLVFGHWQWLIKRSKPAILVGYSIFTLGQLGYLIIDSPGQLFIIQVMLGLATAILEPTWDGLYSQNLSNSQAAMAWSRWAAARDISSGIAAFIGGAIVAYYSFAVLFIVMGVLNLVMLISLLPLVLNNDTT